MTDARVTPVPDEHRPDGYQVDDGFVDELAMERSRAQVRRRTIWRIGAGLVGPGVLCAGALMIAGVHPGAHQATLLSQQIPDPATVVAPATASSTAADALAGITGASPCPAGRQPAKPTKTPSALRVRRELRAQQRRAHWSVKAAPRRACVPIPALAPQTGGGATASPLAVPKAAKTHETAPTPKTANRLTHAQHKAQVKQARQAANRAARQLARAAISNPVPQS